MYVCITMLQVDTGLYVKLQVDTGALVLVNENSGLDLCVCCRSCLLMGRYITTGAFDFTC